MEDTRILDRDPNGGAWLAGRTEDDKWLHLERWRVAPPKLPRRRVKSLCGLMIEPVGYIASYEEPSSLCERCWEKREAVLERQERQWERDAEDDTYSCYQAAEDWNGFHDND